jgi:predicted  nucleic acid-binding Zn-ribbon protein
MSKKAITKEELDNILTLQNTIAQLLHKIGVAETEKHALLHELAGVNQDQGKLKNDLEAKYGPIDINLEDGTYTEHKPAKDE